VVIIGPECMNIFFDTEFTGLVSESRLLSMGLVADDDKELYIEFTDGWSEAQCSPWVLQHVMPMLGSGERLSRREAVVRLLDWLSAYDSPILLADSDSDSDSDSDWYTLLLKALLQERGVTGTCVCVKQLVFSSRGEAAPFEDAKKGYFELLKVEPHHALTDALAMRSAWHSVVKIEP